MLAVVVVVTCAKGTVTSHPTGHWEKHTFLVLWRQKACTLHALDGSMKQSMMQYFGKKFPSIQETHKKNQASISFMEMLSFHGSPGESPSVLYDNPHSLAKSTCAPQD